MKANKKMELVTKNDVLEMNDNMQGLIDANIEEAVEFICKAKRVIECGADQKFIREFIRTVRTAEKYTIDLDNVWEWLGYDKKANCKKALSKLDKDSYISNKIAKGGVGRKQEKILLTSHAFKQLCLKTQTEQGEKIRNYYIALEEVALEFIKFKTLSLVNNIAEQPIEYLPVEINLIEDIPNISTIDINDYIKCSCLYLFYLEENIYKYGITDDIIERSTFHKNYFKKYNIIPKLITIWKLDNSSVTRSAETKIKNYASYAGISIKKYGVTELFKSDDINDMIVRIGKYVSFGDNDELSERIKNLEAENKKLLIELEFIREYKAKFDTIHNENTRLKIELAQQKLENNIITERLNNQIKVSQSLYMIYCNPTGMNIEQNTQKAIQGSPDINNNHTLHTWFRQRKN